MPMCCAECGYDRNAADYTFCGRCGSALQRSALRVPRPASAAQADTFLNGPSFLGLAGPSTVVNDSQVEEPAPLPNPWRARLALMLLLVAGLIFLLRHEGNSWRGLWDSRHESETSIGTIPSSNHSTVNSSSVKNPSAETLPGPGNGSVPTVAPLASAVPPAADRKLEASAPAPTEPAQTLQPTQARPRQPEPSAVSTARRTGC